LDIEFKNLSVIIAGRFFYVIIWMQGRSSAIPSTKSLIWTQ
jgi:hypothetical protein